MPMNACISPWQERSLGSAGHEIAPNEIHLWRARHAAVREPPPLDCLSSDEQRRADRLLIPSRRKAFGFARAVLRVVIGACLSVEPARLRFATTAEGKPYLPGQELRFSLSHSVDGVLLALAMGRDVGVDLEATGREIDAEHLAAASLSEAERTDYDAIDKADRGRAMLRRWTCKEALLKADGSGLTYDPRDLTLPCGMAEAMPARVHHGGRIWTVTDLRLGDAWQASLAIEGEIGTVRGYCLGW